MPAPVFNELKESTSVLVGSEPSTGFFHLNERAPPTEWFTGTPPDLSKGLDSEEDEAQPKNPELQPSNEIVDEQVSSTDDDNGVFSIDPTAIDESRTTDIISAEALEARHRAER